MRERETLIAADRQGAASRLAHPPWLMGEPPPAFLHIVEAFQALDASDMPPATRELWEDARRAALELAVLHLTALSVADFAHGFVEAHSEWRRRRGPEAPSGARPGRQRPSRPRAPCNACWRASGKPQDPRRSISEAASAERDSTSQLSRVLARCSNTPTALDWASA
jgi:hypothetical protein